MGRWMEKDPLANVQGANSYECPESNPVSYRDPRGLHFQPELVPGRRETNLGMRLRLHFPLRYSSRGLHHLDARPSLTNIGFLARDQALRIATLRHRPSGRLTPTVQTVSFARMIPTRNSAPQDRMLDAAEAVVMRDGIANLALDAVAAAAGVSKGGLLHYFPSKDRLIESLVARCAEHWREGALHAYESTPQGPGRMARALLGMLGDAPAWTEQCQQSSSAAFAALAQNPRLIEPMRAVYSELRQRLADDGLGPGIGETVLVAIDGLWLNRVLGLAPVDRPRMERIRRTLETLLPQAQERAKGVKQVFNGRAKARGGTRTQRRSSR